MEFKQFWEKNKNRYFELSRMSIELVINTACEDAWEQASQQSDSANLKYRKAALILAKRLKFYRVRCRECKILNR